VKLVGVFLQNVVENSPKAGRKRETNKTERKKKQRKK
jgi:hypothetical protein